MRERIVVTGAAGFIGAHLCRALVTTGAQVFGLDDLSHGRMANLASLTGHPLFEFEKRDVQDGPGLALWFRKCVPTHVVHLAAIHYIPECEQRPIAAIGVNVIGTANVIEAAALTSVTHLLFASTGAVYAWNDQAHREDDAVEPKPDVYSLSKLAGEQTVRSVADTGRIPASTILRLFNVYGPGETNPHLIPAVWKQLAADQRSVRIGNASPKRDYIHVDDVVRAISFALRSQPRWPLETFNVGTGIATAAGDLTRLLVKASGRHADVYSDVDLQRAIDRPFLVADIRHTVDVLGWHPAVALNDGLKELFRLEPV